MKAITTLNETQIQKASTDELKRHLAGSLEITAKHMMYMATIWRELEDRGEDLSDLRHGLAAYLPLIAHNRIDAHLVIKYAGQKTLLAALSSLPIEEQRRVAETGRVPVVRIEGDTPTEVQTPLTQLAAADVNLVFSEDKVRTPSEQAALLERRQSKVGGKKRPRRKARRVKIDREERVLLVSNSAADIDRVVDQLSEFYGIDLQSIIQAETAKG